MNEYIHHVKELPMLEDPVVAVDIETSVYYGDNADPYRDHILAIQMSNGRHSYITTDPEGYGSVCAILENPDQIKIIHNANFDLQFLIHQLGAKPNKHTLWDSLLVERVLNTGKDISNGLGDVAARRLGVVLKKEVRESFKKHVGELTPVQIEYACEDVFYLPAIYHQQVEDVSQMQLGRVVALENRILCAVARMSLSGVRYDPELWQTYVPQIKAMLVNLEQQVGEQGGLAEQLTLFGDSETVINLNSSNQVLDLFASKGIRLTKRGPDGNMKPTTDRKVVAEFIADNPGHRYIQLLKNVVEWKQWRHTLSTNYEQYINPVTGLIHCTWNQIQADTGRFSASDPNMQNVERPVEDKPNLRRLFLPPVGYKFVDLDFHQQEPRALAQISGDEKMRKACMELDVYVAFGERMSTNPPRQKVKTGFLAHIYGASDETLASHMSTSLEDAKIFSRDIDAEFVTARRYVIRNRDAAQSSGFTRTLLGRIRYYPELENKKLSNRTINEITNSPIQGSGADMLKLAIDKVDDMIAERGYDAWITLAIHDELVVTCREDQADEFYYQAIGCMEEAGRELCPDVLMPAEGSILERWDKT